jgi:hypothetical protein
MDRALGAQLRHGGRPLDSLATLDSQPGAGSSSDRDCPAGMLRGAGIGGRLAGHGNPYQGDRQSGKRVGGGATTCLERLWCVLHVGRSGF